MGESYVNPVSGGTIAGGRNYILPTCALVGDSLTDPTYGLTPFYWGNGLNGGKLQLLANCGVSGNTIEQMTARIANLYTDPSPGLAGLTPIGFVLARAGTNNARNGESWATVAPKYAALASALIAKGQRVVLGAVPPLAGAYIAQNSKTADYNSGLAAMAAADPAHLTFMADCINVRDGAGAQITSFFSDGTHMNNAGVYQIGIDQAPLLASLLSAYSSPLSKDPADIYPAQPQWITNPANIGTGGGKGSNVTGTVVNGVSVSIGGTSSASCSIVAADAGDANQTPWQRVSMLTGSTSGSVTASFTTNGRSITAADPSLLEAMVEFRFNAVDMTKLDTLNLYLQANTGEYLVPKIPVHMGNASGQTKTVVLRHKLKRSGATTPASIQALLAMTFSSAFASSIGSFDFRCCTIRG